MTEKFSGHKTKLKSNLTTVNWKTVASTSTLSPLLFRPTILATLRPIRLRSAAENKIRLNFSEKKQKKLYFYFRFADNRSTYNNRRTARCRQRFDNGAAGDHRMRGWGDDDGRLGRRTVRLRRPYGHCCTLKRGRRRRR